MYVFSQQNWVDIVSCVYRGVVSDVGSVSRKKSVSWKGRWGSARSSCRPTSCARRWPSNVPLGSRRTPASWTATAPTTWTNCTSTSVSCNVVLTTHCVILKTFALTRYRVTYMYTVVQITPPPFTPDKGGGKCVCRRSFVCLSVCLSVSKITQKRVHGFGWNVACRQMSRRGRTA